MFDWLSNLLNQWIGFWGMFFCALIPFCSGCGDPHRDTIEDTKASLRIVKSGPFGTGLSIVDSSNAGSELEGSYISKDGTTVTFKGKRDQDVATSNASIATLMPFMQEQLNAVILDRENQRQALLKAQVEARNFMNDLGAMISPLVMKHMELNAAGQPNILDQLLKVQGLIDSAKAGLPGPK